MTSHFVSIASRLLDETSQISTNPSNQQQQQQSGQQKGPQTFVYIVLGLLIFGFIFFVVNTIRCYLTRPRDADFEDEEMMEEEIGSTELGHASPQEQNTKKHPHKFNK